MENKMEEVWKDVKDFPGYKVSSLGRIRGPLKIFGMKPDKDGYVRVSLWKGGKQYTKTVHLIVCTTFHGEKPSPELLALHRDDIKHNNTPGNLYWGTKMDNIRDYLGNGRVYRGGSRKVHLK